MIWELGNDSFDDLSLLRAIDQTIQADCPLEMIQTYYLDKDRDGYGDLRHPIQACQPPMGYVQNLLDCDDTRQDIHPGVIEIQDGLDNNCDGIRE